MNRPSLSARLAGQPPVAIVLFIGYAAVVLGWYQGHVAWWLAVGAVAAAFRTLGALRSMRRYKAWLAEWQAMGGVEEPTPPLTRPGRRWMLVTGAALLLLIIPMCMSQPGTAPGLWDGALLALWLVDCLWLVFMFARVVLRRRTGGGKARAEVAASKAEAAPRDEATPISWLVGRAASSPSRADAERELPEYCARLIDRG